MWVFEGDIGCSAVLDRYGEFSRFEQAVIDAHTTRDSIVLDIGAHIGAFTIPTARRVAKVFAFEPQEDVREVLQKNLEINDIRNVEVLPYAVGWKSGVGKYTSQPTDNGSVGLRNEGEKEVRVVSLDELDLPPMDFIKVDVEGMELQVLAGARDTIIRCRPTLFLERPTNDDKMLVNCLAMFRYTSFLMDLPIFVPTNFRGDQVNNFPSTAHKMNLAIPQ